MKFEVSRTSSWGTEETPCNNVTKETITCDEPGRIFAYKYYTREFNTLEELMDFIKNEANNKVVIQWNEFSNLYEVEIYDDWRE